MVARITIALVATFVIGSASAALAAPYSLPILKPLGCTTDEGQGRVAPCNTGGGGQ
jgi:hypothetical protein